MAVKSNNPEQTSGKANKPIPQYSFPLTEALPVSTKLRFEKYDRFNPRDNASANTSAIITLPLPSNIPENYSIRTNTTDLGMWGNVSRENAQKIIDVGNSNDWDPNKVMETGKAMVTTMLQNRNFSGAAALGGLARAVGVSDNKMDLVKTFTGIMQNPHTTIMFEGVNLRTIYLEWRLAASSEDESRAIRNIFNTIKLLSHPPELAGGYALNYPDLIYIEFTGKVADYLPKYERAFVSNINITPDSSGGINFFKSGAPTTYTLQLTATELSILTRDTIQRHIEGQK